MQSFQELNLSAQMMQAITELGYEKPSAIQAEALPLLLAEPTDFLGLAATGTGKTAAFAIPLLERIDPSRRVVQALILCPTRELALQVSGQINLLGKYKGVRALPIYGGAGYRDQFRGLDQGVSIVVGTPGRVVDHIQKGSLKLDKLSVIILDEADEMISMGFKDDLETVLNEIPEESSNIWLFSATMSREVRRVADDYLRQPKQVQINRTEMLPSTVEQIFYVTSESNKPEILCKIIDAADDFYGIVFCQTKQLVMDVTHFLSGRGYRVDCLHGDKNQNDRERTMQSFRDRRVQLLICTDVASRGLDVKDITHVINYSLPRELDSYVHRIGRTARSGKAGFAMSLVTPSHRGLVQRIERMTKSRMHEGKVPTRKDIGVKKIANMLAKFQDQPAHTRAVELMNEEWKTAISEMSREEIVARFLAYTMPDIFAAEREKPAQQTSNKPSPIKPMIMVSPMALAVASARPAKRVEAPVVVAAVAAPADSAERYGVVADVEKPKAPWGGASHVKPGPVQVQLSIKDIEAIEKGESEAPKPKKKPAFEKRDVAQRDFGGREFKKPYEAKKTFGAAKPFAGKPSFAGAGPKPFGGAPKPFGEKKPFIKRDGGGDSPRPFAKPRGSWGDKPLKRGSFNKSS